MCLLNKSLGIYKEILREFLHGKGFEPLRLAPVDLETTSLTSRTSMLFESINSKSVVLPRLELGLRDSKSRVLTFIL